MGRGHALLGLEPPQSSARARQGGPGAQRGSAARSGPSDQRLLSLAALESHGEPGKSPRLGGSFAVLSKPVVR